ncbi:mechanosensitive ion channel protein MscS [Catellatospora methionotrophica]|uniref:Mechanosensitive ion channel protein MscS n=1 Tax=Catellatospora methionotrophica TaxID=121620 RepID=A0A8J3PG05_9ACTN|nr:mechanosensitive ion channel family protein [Catellatospora methionotrophica]GIG13781.1 mechanosensitive ion channel protein MscS [Catellatospora methionotrophica]
MPLSLLAPDPATPCTDTDQICQWLYNVTDSAWLADGGYYLLIKPIRIIVIIVVALIARSLLNHTINKIVARTAQGKVPTMLRPIRVPVAVLNSGSMFPERRRQRAEAIGSVLKSMVTVGVFSVAFLIVLSEFDVNVGPLIASLGIVGVALGFGAQSLVKDLIAGLFMLLEDQYGVGDVIDTGEAVGVVESVGLRTVTIRDGRGVIWYVRNGEIIRIGNKSQGWATVMIDVPIGFVGVEDATAVLRQAVDAFANDPEWSADFVEPPQVLGVENISVDGAVIRTVCKTSADRQWDLQREMRRRLTEALEASGIAAQMQAARAMRTAVPADEPTAP